MSSVEIQRIYPNEALAFSDTKKEFSDFFKKGEILMQFLGQGAESNDDLTTYIDDPQKRLEAVIEYAKKHQAQIYTEVDGDDGEIYYSKGVRFCNRINQGLYTVVKIDGLKVDNS